MRRIIITEKQLQKLVEDAPTLNGGDLKEYPGSEVSMKANVTDVDTGKPKHGKSRFTDNVADDTCSQNNYNGRATNSRIA